MSSFVISTTSPSYALTRIPFIAAIWDADLEAGYLKLYNSGWIPRIRETIRIGSKLGQDDLAELLKMINDPSYVPKRSNDSFSSANVDSGAQASSTGLASQVMPNVGYSASTSSVEQSFESFPKGSLLRELYSPINLPTNPPVQGNKPNSSGGSCDGSGIMNFTEQRMDFMDCSPGLNFGAKISDFTASPSFVESPFFPTPINPDVHSTPLRSGFSVGLNHMSSSTTSPSSIESSFFPTPFNSNVPSTPLRSGLHFELDRSAQYETPTSVPWFIAQNQFSQNHFDAFNNNPEEYYGQNSFSGTRTDYERPVTTPPRAMELNSAFSNSPSLYSPSTNFSSPFSSAGVITPEQSPGNNFCYPLPALPIMEDNYYLPRLEPWNLPKPVEVDFFNDVEMEDVSEKNDNLEGDTDDTDQISWAERLRPRKAKPVRLIRSYSVKSKLPVISRSSSTIAITQPSAEPERELSPLSDLTELDLDDEAESTHSLPLSHARTTTKRSQRSNAKGRGNSYRIDVKKSPNVPVAPAKSSMVLRRHSIRKQLKVVKKSPRKHRTYTRETEALKNSTIWKKGIKKPEVYKCPVNRCRTNRRTLGDFQKHLLSHCNATDIICVCRNKWGQCRFAGIDKMKSHAQTSKNKACLARVKQAVEEEKEFLEMQMKVKKMAKNSRSLKSVPKLLEEMKKFRLECQSRILESL